MAGSSFTPLVVTVTDVTADRFSHIHDKLRRGGSVKFLSAPVYLISGLTTFNTTDLSSSSCHDERVKPLDVFFFLSQMPLLISALPPFPVRSGLSALTQQLPSFD